MLAVIGSQGLVGRHVTAYLRQRGHTVRTFSHRPGADECVDLHRPVEDFPFHRLRGVSWALICSAESRLDACAQDRTRSYRMNVTHTIALLERMFRYEIVPIFCSSDLVFDGVSGHYSEGDRRNPTTEYGRHKKAVEDYLFRQSRPWVILRFSKLYEGSPEDESPVGTLARQLRGGEIVRCAADQLVTPTYIRDVAEVIDWCIETRRYGCYHVAGPQSMSRYELGLKIAKPLQREHLVQQCSLDDLAFFETRPRNATLDTQKVQALYPGSFTFLDDVLPHILDDRSLTWVPGPKRTQPQRVRVAGLSSNSRCTT